MPDKFCLRENITQVSEVLCTLLLVQIGERRRNGKTVSRWAFTKLDLQHRGLLDLINKIGDLAYTRGAVKSSAFSALNEMIRYADNHFRTEEGYLREILLPGI